jgi:hypothetical protein
MICGDRSDTIRGPRSPRPDHGTQGNALTLLQALSDRVFHPPARRFTARGGWFKRPCNRPGGG